MKYYTVIDLEWTSWDKNYYGKYFEKEKRERWQKKEIIQIGAIKFNKKFKIKDTLNLIIKPRINKKLSKYIINLTSITNEIIQKKGIEFLDGYKKLKKFSNKSFIFSNGEDGMILKKNLNYNNSPDSEIKILNIKKFLKKNTKYQKIIYIVLK